MAGCETSSLSSRGGAYRSSACGSGTSVGVGDEAEEDACELRLFGQWPLVLHEGERTLGSGWRAAEWWGGSGSCVSRGLRRW